MALYMTTMLTLPFNHLNGGEKARFHDISPPIYAPNIVYTPLLLVKTLRTVLRGRVHCHRGLRLSLSSLAGTLYYKTHVTAGLSPKLFGLASYSYKIIEAIGRVKKVVCRSLGNGAPASTRDWERPITRPTIWFCHECETGPYNIATQAGCTNVIDGRQCDHHMCAYCRKE